MSDYEYNHDYNQYQRTRCGSSDHHTIEYTIGEDPIDYNVINVTLKCEEQSESAVCLVTTHIVAPSNSLSQITQEDASTEGDLINLEEDVEAVSAKSSQTDYENELKDLVISPVKLDFSCELSPATPNYEARFEEDLAEAMRRSLQGSKVYELCEQTHQSYEGKGKGKDPSFEPDQDQFWSNDEDFKNTVNKSVEKVKGWQADDNVGSSGSGGDAATSVSGEDEDFYELINNVRQWETKATPKTLKNRELLPRSSFLAFENTLSPAKTRGRTNSQNKRLTGPVTRTPNTETNTVTVSSLRQKRRGRRDQRSYYDITPELQYLR